MTANQGKESVSERDERPRSIPLLLKAAWIIVPGVQILFEASQVSTEFGYVVLGTPLLLLFWIATVTWTALYFIRVDRWRRWRKTTKARAVVPGAIILAIITFFPFLHTCLYIGGALRFAMTRSAYDHQVALLAADDKPRLAMINWGGMIWASRGVVYNESDEIALPHGQQSAAWVTKAGMTELGCGWSEDRLWSHYYLVSFPC